jgi:hypothetical protein
LSVDRDVSTLDEQSSSSRYCAADGDVGRVRCFAESHGTGAAADIEVTCIERGGETVTIRFQCHIATGINRAPGAAGIESDDVSNKENVRAAGGDITTSFEAKVISGIAIADSVGTAVDRDVAAVGKYVDRLEKDAVIAPPADTFENDVASAGGLELFVRVKVKDEPQLVLRDTANKDRISRGSRGLQFELEVSAVEA